MAFPAVSTKPKKVLSEGMRSPDKDLAEVSLVNNTIKIVLLVEYDGSCYHGFQLQTNLPTIQGEIERALKRLTGDRVRVITASRTDTGVHARGQVVSFRTKSLLTPRTFVNGLNYYLPRDIAVKAAYRADASFNVRRRALSREYSYNILNSQTRSPMWKGFSYLVSGELDIEAMNLACQLLVGEHDFASFASNLGVEIKSTRRRVYQARVYRSGELVIFDMVANSFLSHQVRNTVGALIRVGLGRMTVEEFHSIMEEKKIGLAGPAAPACGLCLIKVNYQKPFKEEGSEDI
jgi:tRNA pseudouridine38-40 synthase